MTRRRPNAPLTPPMGGGDPTMMTPTSGPPQPLPIKPKVAPEETTETVDPPQETDPESLSPEEMGLFVSLLTCGRKTKTVTIFKHTVVVQSLCGDDDLRIGLFVKDYQGSLGEQRAYQIGVAAAGIRSIDGQPVATSLGPVDEGVLFDEKVKKISAMYPTVIIQIYRGVLDAEKEFVELSERLGK